MMDSFFKDSLVKMVWVIVIFMVLFMGLVWLFYVQIEVVGSWFVLQVGYWGIGIGIFLFDAFILFILPDVYLVVVVIVEMDLFRVIVAGSFGSILGGIVVYGIGYFLGDTRFVERLVSFFCERGVRFIDRLGVIVVILVVLMFIFFFIVCILVGMMGM